jgi:hypothetical protein
MIRSLVCFVCHIEITQITGPCYTLGIVEKPLTSTGVLSCFGNIYTYDVGVIVCWTILLLKIQQNQN